MSRRNQTTLVKVSGRWVLARWNPRIGQYSVLDNQGGRCYGPTIRDAVEAAYRVPLSAQTKEEALELAGRIKEINGRPISKVPVVKVTFTRWLWREHSCDIRVKGERVAG